MIRRLRSLHRDARGSTLVEFALVAPTLLLMLMGLFDLSYRAWATAQLQGAVQKAGRDSTLEGANAALAGLDQRVRNQVQPLMQNGTLTFNRLKYASFTRAGQAENFTDGNANGIREAGECYQDENANSTWDADSGTGGNGGARDIVVYTATLSYPRIFPMYGLAGWSPTQVISATTVLRNQPFGNQAATTSTVICT